MKILYNANVFIPPLAGGLEIERMVEAGLQRAKSFSWRPTAQCTFDVYTKAQSGRG